MDELEKLNKEAKEKYLKILNKNLEKILEYYKYRSGDSCAEPFENFKALSTLLQYKHLFDKKDDIN